MSTKNKNNNNAANAKKGAGKQQSEPKKEQQKKPAYEPEPEEDYDSDAEFDEEGNVIKKQPQEKAEKDGSDEESGEDGQDDDKTAPGGAKKLTKKDLRKLNKLRKAGKLTEEQRQMLDPNYGASEQVESKEAYIAREQNESALQSYEAKKGVITSNTKDIQVEKFTLAYHGKVLFHDADLKISYGRKYGLIGPNGMGKSTLLKHISQRHLPIPAHIRILHVEQEVEGTDTLALDAVLEADQERLQLLAEEKDLKKVSAENTDEGFKANDRLMEVYKRLKEINAYSAEGRASAILSGLQFTEEMKKMPTKKFSGGWRMRIALARALFLSPDLLLLDEPTNHLDLNAVIWLEAYLRKWKKTLLVVSHDRDFLNYIVTDIMHLHKQRLDYYKGDYDSFEKIFTDKKKQRDKKYKLQEKERNKLLEKQTKNANDKKKKMEKEGMLQRDDKEYSVKFIFADPGPLSIPVVQIKDVTFGYSPEKILFRHVELNVGMESRVAIVGPNGIGKSTLMNLILGELNPIAGEIIRNRKLRVSKFSQHFVDQLTMTDTPVEFVGKKFPELKPQEVRNTLGKFGLSGKTHLQPIQLLSGGQKSRVALCTLSLELPHILLLDEPTNHLDIQSVDALSESLAEFEGAVVLISHDQRLISKVCDELWVCGDQKVEVYDGTFEEYRQELIDKMDDELFMDSDEEQK